MWGVLALSCVGGLSSIRYTAPKTSCIRREHDRLEQKKGSKTSPCMRCLCLTTHHSHRGRTPEFVARPAVRVTGTVQLAGTPLASPTVPKDHHQLPYTQLTSCSGACSHSMPHFASPALWYYRMHLHRHTLSLQGACPVNHPDTRIHVDAILIVLAVTWKMIRCPSRYHLLSRRLFPREWAPFFDADTQAFGLVLATLNTFDITPDALITAGSTPDALTVTRIAPDALTAIGIAPDAPTATGIAPDAPTATGIAPDALTASGLAPDACVDPAGPHTYTSKPSGRAHAHTFAVQLRSCIHSHSLPAALAHS